MQRQLPLLTAVVAVAMTLSAPSIAQAGPSCFTKLTFVSWVTGGKVASSSEASAESRAVIRRPDSLYRWDLGMWVGGMGLGAPGKDGRGHHDDEDLVDFGGAGLQARYRMRRAWGLELSLGALHSEAEGGTERDMMPLTASLMYYLTPTSLFQIYGLAGLGVAPTRWHDPETDTTIGASTAGIAQAGLGVALDLHPIRINADVRGIALKPSLGDDEGPPRGSVPCANCSNGVVPIDAARSDRSGPLAGSAVHLGASIVF